MNAIPPLLALANGRKPRLRRAPLRASVIKPKEIVLHMTVAKLLREHCRKDWRYTHIPSGELRDKLTARKLKQMGTVAGFPDFILIAATGLIHCLELKRIGGKLTREQESYRLWCIKRGIPYVVAHTIDEVLAAFDEWQCVRVIIPKCRTEVWV